MTTDKIEIGAGEFSITIEDLDEAIREIENIDKYVIDEMTLAMRRGVDILENAIVQYTPVGATALLRDAWGTQVQRGLNVVKGIVSNPLEYAIVVEKGREAGGKAPMVKTADGWRAVPALELWVERVIGVGGEEGQRIAFNIARKIKARTNKGADGVGMVRKGIAATKSIIEADFARIPARVKAKVDL